MSDASPVPQPRYDLCHAAHDYPEWAGPPRRSLLICTQARSGSTLLGEALYFAGGLGCPLEYLHSGFKPGFKHRWRVDGVRSLIRAAWRHRTDPGGTLAIKLFWQDVVDIAEELAPGDFPLLRSTPAKDVPPDTYRAINALLRELFPHPVHVHLDRRDRLRQAVSALTAIQTDVWRRIPQVEGTEPVIPANYDEDRITSLIAGSLAAAAHWHAFFAANAIVPHEVVYEDLAADYGTTVERLLHALGSDATPPAARMERQSNAHSEALMRRFLHDQRTALRR